VRARSAEATAPCRVDLAGGARGALAVSASVDRRAWCRVEAGGAGVEIRSKDSPVPAAGRSVSELLESSVPGPVAPVLRALGAEDGIRVVTQSRVPQGAGLGEALALAVAVAGALARVLGRDLPEGEIARLAAAAVAAGDEGAVADALAAAHGGVLAVRPGPEGPLVDSSGCSRSSTSPRATSAASCAPRCATSATSLSTTGSGRRTWSSGPCSTSARCSTSTGRRRLLLHGHVLYEQIHLSAEALGDSVHYLLPDRPSGGVLRERAGRHRAAADGGPEGDRHGARHQGRDGQRAGEARHARDRARRHVPPFINTGDVVRVNTETGEYLSRA
jgi:hypothetical protein